MTNRALCCFVETRLGIGDLRIALVKRGAIFLYLYAAHARDKGVAWLSTDNGIADNI